MSEVAGRGGLWSNPGFWFGLSMVTGIVLVPIWLWGAFSGGLDVEETCTLGEGQRF
ncbi:hypothetical protein [Streptomyces sp. NPDC055134]